MEKKNTRNCIYVYYKHLCTVWKIHFFWMLQPILCVTVCLPACVCYGFLLLLFKNWLRCMFYVPRFTWTCCFVNKSLLSSCVGYGSHITKALIPYRFLFLVFFLIFLIFFVKWKLVVPIAPSSNGTNKWEKWVPAQAYYFYTRNGSQWHPLYHIINSILLVISRMIMNDRLG